MPKFFVEENQIKNNEIINICGSDINHIKNVLRKKIGNEIIVCNKSNSEDFLCEITKICDNNIECKIKEKLNNNVESNVLVTIYQGLPKADKMELIIQKSVELGVFEITPIEMGRCVVKLNGKDSLKKIQRWQKISEVAAKQCGRGKIPKINNITNIKNICNLIPKYDIVLLAYENEEKNTLKNELQKIKEQCQSFNKNLENINIAVIIGPEGGITEDEVATLKQAGAKVITLGKRILRTETVAINILSIIMYELENG